MAKQDVEDFDVRRQKGENDDKVNFEIIRKEGNTAIFNKMKFEITREKGVTGIVR